MTPEFDKDRTFDSVSAYGSDRWVAATLGSSTDWLKKNRPTLEREGFPVKDALFGLTLKVDVEAFLGKRRRVADFTSAAHHESHSAGVRHDHL